MIDMFSYATHARSKKHAQRVTALRARMQAMQDEDVHSASVNEQSEQTEPTQTGETDTS